MSQSGKMFDLAIKDAEDLLSRFDNENNSSQERNPESLKRSGMIMALSAWETYIKDRFKEEVAVWLCSLDNSPVGKFIQRKVDEDLKRFFNPNSQRTKKLFNDYFEVDITEYWEWDNYNSTEVRTKLNELISKRGEAAHQANTGLNQPHIIKREELEKAIRFLKGLVRAMESINFLNIN